MKGVSPKERFRKCVAKRMQREMSSFITDCGRGEMCRLADAWCKDDIGAVRGCGSPAARRRRLALPPAADAANLGELCDFIRNMYDWRVATYDHIMRENMRGHGH